MMIFKLASRYNKKQNRTFSKQTIYYVVLFCTIDNEYTEDYYYSFVLDLVFAEMEAFTRWMDLEMVKYGSCACKTSFIETQNIEVKSNIKTNENVKKKSCEQNFFVD